MRNPQPLPFLLRSKQLLRPPPLSSKQLLALLLLLTSPQPLPFLLQSKQLLRPPLSSSPPFDQHNMGGVLGCLGRKERVSSRNERWLDNSSNNARNSFPARSLNSLYLEVRSCGPIVSLVVRILFCLEVAVELYSSCQAEEKGK